MVAAIFCHLDSGAFLTAECDMCDGLEWWCDACVTQCQNLRLKLRAARRGASGFRPFNSSGMRQAGSTISIPTKLLATGVACALAVVVCGTAASVVVASEASSKQKAWSRGARQMVAARGSAQPFRDLGAQAALLDSIVAPLGVAQVASPLDVATLIAFSSAESRQNPVWDVSPLTPSLGAPPRAMGRPGGFKFVFDSLSPDWIASAAADTANTWMPLFRRLARSKPLPALWGYRNGLPGLEAGDYLPQRSYKLTAALFSANEGGGVLALRAGRFQEAAERARENIAASRHFIEQPNRFDAQIGHHRLRRGVMLLALAAQRSGDSATIHLAARLDSAVKPFDIFPRFLVDELEDPNSRTANEVIANKTLHPALRISAMSSIVLGGCRNTPEVVLGFSATRHEALNRAVEAVSDIPRGRELAQLHARRLEHMMSKVDAVGDPPRGSVLDRNELLKLFSWIIPPGVRARAKLCLEQG